MYIRDDGVWIQTTEGAFINLDYVAAVCLNDCNATLFSFTLEDEGESEGGWRRYSNKRQYTFAESEVDALREYFEYGKAITYIGDCIWTLPDSKTLVNLNHIEKVDFDVCVDYGEGRFPAYIRLSINNETLALYNRKAGIQFCEYFSILTTAMPEYCSWMPLSLNKIKPYNDVGVNKWIRAVKQFNGNNEWEYRWAQITDKSVADVIFVEEFSPDEIQVMEAITECIYRPQEIKDKLIEWSEIIFDSPSELYKICKYVGWGSSFMLVKSVEELQNAEDMQDEIADILIELSKQGIAVRVHVNELSKSVPVLLKRIYEYNETVLAEKKRRREDYSIWSAGIYTTKSDSRRRITLPKLLENNAEKARFVKDNFVPRFKSMDEYFEAVSAFDKEKDAVVYNEDGTVTLDFMI